MNLGKKGEELASLEYQKLGYQVIGRNIRIHLSRQVGEIDLIAEKERELVFVEVKTRRSGKFGCPSDAVSRKKQQKLVRTAKLYLLQKPQYDNWPCRFDVAEVDVDNPQNPVIILMNVIEDSY